MLAKNGNLNKLWKLDISTLVSAPVNDGHRGWSIATMPTIALRRAQIRIYGLSCKISLKLYRDAHYGGFVTLKEE